MKKDFIHIGETVKNQEGMGHLFTLKILNLLLVLTLVGCSNLPKNMEWKKAKEIGLRWEELRTGDIIIKNKKPTPISWLGHAAIMVSDNYVGDYPRAGVNYYEVDSYSWLYEKRNVVVLRYKYFDERFKMKLLENIEEYKDRDYALHFDKYDDTKFYCSQFIWYLYWKTAQDLGYKLDIDSDGGGVVTPYDLIYSEDLVEVFLD